MQFKSLYLFVLMTLGAFLVHGATQNEGSCFNPKWKSYSSWAEFSKEFLSKFDNTDVANLGDPGDSAQAFVCASATLKWLRSFGKDTYWLVVTNQTRGNVRIFGADIGPGGARKGEIVNGKGYYIWRQAGVCKMVRFRDNSSIIFKENIQIKDDGLYGGPLRSQYKLNSCTIVNIDNELCDNEFLTMPQEAYVFDKWVARMKTCGTTHAQ